MTNFLRRRLRDSLFLKDAPNTTMPMVPADVPPVIDVPPAPYQRAMTGADIETREDLQVIDLRNETAFTYRTTNQSFIRIAGRTLLFDQAAGASDIIIQVKPNDARRWENIYPGQLHVLKGQGGFRDLRVRFINRFAFGAIAANTFLGRLIISENLESSFVGTAPAARIFTQALPGTTSPFTIAPGTSNVFVANGVAGTPFSFTQSLVTGSLSRTNVQSDVMVKNIGLVSVFVSIVQSLNFTFLTDTALNRTTVYELKPGEKETFVLSGQPASPPAEGDQGEDDVINVTAGDPQMMQFYASDVNAAVTGFVRRYLIG